MDSQTIRSMILSPLHVHEVSIFADDIISGPPNRSWMVHLENIETRQKSPQFKLVDPFSSDDYNELQWYMEDFALKDPFSSNRADDVAKNQIRYGRDLNDTIRPFINEICLYHGGSTSPSLGGLHLLVIGDGTSDSLHSLHWEYIERIDCQRGETTYITVSRVPKVTSTFSSARLPNRNLPLRILYVSARPGLDEDIGYRVISGEILRLAEETSKSTSKVTIEFVRPGTWAKFKNKLKLREHGFFDIVHLDMHGTIRRQKGKDTAFLHFSSRGAAAKKPDPKSSKQITEELAKHGVGSVILNACNGATTGTSEVSNLAYALASHEIGAVVAMVYKVKTDAAVVAMRELYSSLMNNRENYLGAVRRARAELRMNSDRTGRYGVKVRCGDEFNLVCYLAKPASNVKSGLVQAFTEVLLKTLPSNDVFQRSSSSRGKESLGSNARIIRSIQDLDILSIEELLVGNEVVFITGESGTGKSTLARQMQEWWKRTSFSQSIEYIETLQDVENWLQDSNKGEFNGGDLTEGIFDNDMQSLTEGDLYEYDQILLVDNIESWDTLLQNGDGEKQPAKILNLIKRRQESPGKNRIIFFTRVGEELLSYKFPEMTIYEISIPTVEEASALAAGYLSKKNVSSQTYTADLEHLIKYHRMNLAFLHIFIPYMAQLNVQPRDFIDHLLGDPQVCNFGLFHDYITANRSEASVFNLVHNRVQTWSKEHFLSFRMFLSLCMFQRRIPLDVQYWLSKLFEKGLFSGGRPTINPFPIETGKIHISNLEDGWNGFPPEWNFEGSWTMTRACLETSGLIRKENLASGTPELYFRIHPLIPYFLRHEIAQFAFRDPRKYWSRLRLSYWEYYEWKAISLSQQSTRSLYSSLMSINNDVTNIDEAIKLSIEQGSFPFRVMRIYNLIPCFKFNSMAEGGLKRWAWLLDQVLTRFETYFEKECCDKFPQDHQQLMLLFYLQIANRIGMVFENLNSPKAMTDNVERAFRMKAFTQNLPITSNDAIEFIFYTIQVQGAKAVPVSHWSSTELKHFEELLLMRSPNNPRNGQMKVVKLELANFLIHEKNNIPENHRLHEILKEVLQEGLAFIQNLIFETQDASQLLSLAAKTAITYPINTNSTSSYTSAQNITQVYRSIQNDFLRQAPSNSSSYFEDAKAYTVDLEVMEKREGFKFDRAKLRQVYEIAQQQNHLETQKFCLERLRAAADIDKDFIASRRYLIVLNELDETPVDRLMRFLEEVLKIASGNKGDSGESVQD